MTIFHVLLNCLINSKAAAVEPAHWLSYTSADNATARTVGFYNVAEVKQIRHEEKKHHKAWEKKEKKNNEYFRKKAERN